MIEVELSRIIIDEEKKEQVIVLKEKKGNRMLPIVIGLTEAAAIKMHLSGFNPPRPLTHDLMCEAFKSLDVKIDKIVIDELDESTFHAKLHIRNGKVKIVDARPSDCIALAVRTKSPIFVEPQVFEQASGNQSS
jgi:bifunctional DNase/RNase